MGLVWNIGARSAPIMSTWGGELVGFAYQWSMSDLTSQGKTLIDISKYVSLCLDTKRTIVDS
jgi:hypothetical protein